MGLYTSINTASTGMTAQRTRLDVISNNIANATTTRTPEGGVFKRSRVIFETKSGQTYWRSPFLPQDMEAKIGKGVRITKIEEDNQTKTRLVYDPTHPDAFKSGPNVGYVEFPNVNIVTEMVDMIEASRAYEANASIVTGSKAMFMKALEIGR
jgi:flagellar basal-body rod protein FlgC